MSPEDVITTNPPESKTHAVARAIFDAQVLPSSFALLWFMSLV